MIRIKTNQFNKVCRLCSTLHLYLRCISTESIMTMIEDCAPVHVSLEDGLPQFICEDCFVLLNKITTFRKRCVESEKAFYKSIEEEKNQTENDSIFRVQAKLEVSDSIKTEIENDAPNTVTHFNANNSDSETLINLIRNKQSDTTKYECEFCSKGLISFKEIEKHYKDEHKLKPKECKIKFYYDPILETQDNPLIPTLADSSVKGQIINQRESDEMEENDRLPKRRKRKRIVKYAECQVCHKRMTREALYRHMENIHSNRKRYTCTDCPKTFSCERNVRTHHRIVHLKEPVIKKFLCDLCGHASQKQSALDIHRRTHSTERPYKCDQCPGDYRTKYHLRDHINDKHLNIKPYVCSTCGHAFARKRFLEDHLRTHTGEKPFKCNICEQAFGSQSGLYIHNKTHHD